MMIIMEMIARFCVIIHLEKYYSSP